MYIFHWKLYFYYYNWDIFLLVCTAGHRKVATLFYRWVSKCGLFIKQLILIHEFTRINRLISRLYFERSNSYWWLKLWTITYTWCWYTLPFYIMTLLLGSWFSVVSMWNVTWPIVLTVLPKEWGLLLCKEEVI